MHVIKIIHNFNPPPIVLLPFPNPTPELYFKSNTHVENNCIIY